MGAQDTCLLPYLSGINKPIPPRETTKSVHHQATKILKISEIILFILDYLVWPFFFLITLTPLHMCPLVPGFLFLSQRTSPLHCLCCLQQLRQPNGSHPRSAWGSAGSARRTTQPHWRVLLPPQQLLPQGGCTEFQQLHAFPHHLQKSVLCTA